MGSYFPDQGSNLRPAAVEAQSLNHWTAKEVLAQENETESYQK